MNKKRKINIKTITMTGEILALIIALQSYRHWLVCDMIARNISDDNVYFKCFDYFRTLDLPHEMNTGNSVFEAMMEYPESMINKLKKMKENDINNYVFSYKL